jgi:multiple sugar transport system substrate-binding protein
MSNARDFINRLRNLESYQRNRLILAVVGGFVLILILISLFRVGVNINNVANNETKQGTLVVWNVFDDRRVFDAIIQKYISENPQVRIEYVQKTAENYREDVSSAIAAGRGPDVYAVHNSWLPLEIERLMPMNEALPEINAPVLTRDFPDVFRLDFTRDEIDPRTGETQTMIYALPLSIDTLALYYNVDYFNSANIINPPDNWDEFVETVKQLRQVKNGDVLLAGAALGSALNTQVNRATDILSMLMIQGGAEMQDDFGNVRFDRPIRNDEGATFYPGEDAMNFYTSFSNPNSENYTWPAEGKFSIDAFAEGYAAMMINYSHHRQTIRDLNPNLNFAIASLPKPIDSPIRINYASYWGFAVPRASDNAELAWDFINFMAREENAILYLDATNRPPALRSLIEYYQPNPEIKVFANQILTAKSWIQPNAFEVETALERAISAVLKAEKTIRSAVRDAANEINFGVF